MRKRLVAIYSVLVVAIVLLAVFVPSCVPTEEKGTIWVKATICDTPWEGAVNYTLTPATGSAINGTSVSANFSVNVGTWTCAYVSGGPDGAYFVGIDPPSAQTVAANQEITFTLKFELEQDASIEFVKWTINGLEVTPNTPETFYEVGWSDIIDVHYTQHVAGCQGHEVAVNETSRLSIMMLGRNLEEPVYLYAANNACAVVKEPEPIEKVSQVTRFNGEPVQLGKFYELPYEEAWSVVDVETSWVLEKEIDYTKTINWFAPSIYEGELHWQCLLFELYMYSGSGYHYEFELVSSAEVELVGDEDVNPENNYVEGPSLYLRVWTGD